MRIPRSSLALASALVPLLLAIACGPSSPASAHSTKPLTPADGAKDYDQNPAGPAETKQPVPGPEKPTEPSASAMQPGKNEGK
jgi:hypothetical protein